MSNKILAANIEHRMMELGKDRPWLCEQVGLLPATIDRYLNGTRQPTVYSLYRISKALDCTMEDLIKGANGI